MTLEEDIKDKFLADTDTILEAHLEELEGMFKFHEDNTIELLGHYRELRPENRILLYLIARRYQFEAELFDTDSLSYSYMYEVFPDKDKSTVRGYFMNLRNDGFARKSDDGHELVVERLPQAIDRIESSSSGE